MERRKVKADDLVERVTWSLRISQVIGTEILQPQYPL